MDEQYLTKHFVSALMNFYKVLLLLSFFQVPPSSSITSDTLKQGSSLSAQNAETDVLVSPNGDFSAGFFPVGENAYCFAVWFTRSSIPTIVWMANRDQPVNGRGSKLSLTADGNLVLLDVGRVHTWSTETASVSTVKLQLDDFGNLVLRSSEFTYWESFKFPTHTLLPNQDLTTYTSLVSSGSQSNYSSGYYNFYFDENNILRLRFGPVPLVSSVYWPTPWLGPFETGRFSYNTTKIAVLNSIGGFASSDNLVFSASDYGAKINRRLTLDPDGNLRLYSFDAKNKTWVVTWQAISLPCSVHGICGPNSFCSYHHASGRSCSCVPGFKMINSSDLAFGCEPEFGWTYNQETSFVRVTNVHFYGYDKDYSENNTLKECEEQCLKYPDCKGFQFIIGNVNNQVSKCYTKVLLLNGARMSNFDGDVYIRLPKANLSSLRKNQQVMTLNCSLKKVRLERKYKKAIENGRLKVLVWVAVAMAGVEFICVSVVLCFLYWTKKENKTKSQGNQLAAATRFQKFTYAELRKATLGFRDEIGSGGGGTVYKGVLSDGRVAAIKSLRQANSGEAEFLAEVSTIGRLNHMNLIDMWGYCAEGEHRLLVYEFMKHGSLADNINNLNDVVLDWKKRFAIAVGTAKGLAYLHEECLEWILHCDIKPQNILLDSNYNPKVADFGLSKLQNRGESHNSSFSRIRGTRGYMAPEWVYNLPITSKVDVFSYGIVVLELVTGRKPTGIQMFDCGRMVEHGRLVTWVREKIKGDDDASIEELRIEEIADPLMEGEFDKVKMELLVKVALKCVKEERDIRPTMRQVVEMLQSQCYEDEHAMLIG